MKYTLIAATLLTASLTFAQQTQQREPRTPEERAKNQSERLAGQLSLSADQQSKIYEINLKEINESDAVRKDAALSDDAKKEKLKSIHEARKTSYSQVLTEEQQKKLAESRPMVNDRASHRKNMTPEQRSKMMTDKMSTDLSLTEDQRTKVYDVNLAHAKKADEIRSNTSLSEDDKKAQLKSLREGEKAELKGILTKEQLARLKEMRKENGHGKKSQQEQK